MSKYVVEVCRTVHQTRPVSVEAANPAEARKLALEKAGNMDFQGLEKSADYIVLDMWKVKK